MIFLSYFNKYAYFYSVNKITEYDYINQKVISEKQIDFPYQLPFRRANYALFNYETPNYYETVKVWFDDKTDRNFQFLYDELLEFTPTNIIKVHTTPLCIKNDRFHSKLVNCNGRLMYVSGSCLFEIVFDQNYLTNRKISIKCLSILGSEFVRIHMISDHLIMRDNSNHKVYAYDPYGNIITQQTITALTNYIIIQDNCMITQSMDEDFQGPSADTVIIYLDNNIPQQVKGHQLQDCYYDTKTFQATNCLKYEDIVISHTGFRLSQYVYEKIMGITNLRYQKMAQSFQQIQQNTNTDEIQNLQTVDEVRNYLNKFYGIESTLNDVLNNPINQEQQNSLDWSKNDDSNVQNKNAQLTDLHIAKNQSEVGHYNVLIEQENEEDYYIGSIHDQLRKSRVTSSSNKMKLQHLIFQAKSVKLYRSDEIDFGDLRQAPADLTLWQCIFEEVTEKNMWSSHFNGLEDIEIIYQSHIAVFWLILLNIHVLRMSEEDILDKTEPTKLSQKVFPVERCRKLMDLLLKASISSQQFQYIAELAYKHRETVQKHEFFKHLFNVWNVQIFRKDIFQLAIIRESLQLIQTVENVSQAQDPYQLETWIYEILLECGQWTINECVPYVYRLLQPIQVAYFAKRMLGSQPNGWQISEVLSGFLTYQNPAGLQCGMRLVHKVRQADAAVLHALVTQYILFTGLFRHGHPLEPELEFEQPRNRIIRGNNNDDFINRLLRELIHRRQDQDDLHFHQIDHQIGIQTTKLLQLSLFSLNFNENTFENKYTQLEIDFFNNVTPMPHFLRAFNEKCNFYKAQGTIIANNSLQEQNKHFTSQNNDDTQLQEKQISMFKEVIKKIQLTLHQDDQQHIQLSELSYGQSNSNEQYQENEETSDYEDTSLSINSDNLSEFVQINPDIDKDQYCPYTDQSSKHLYVDINEEFDLEDITEKYNYTLVFDDLKKLYQILIIKIASYYKYSSKTNKNILIGNEISALLQNKLYMTAWNLIQILQEKVLGEQYNRKYAIQISIANNLDEITQMIFQFEANIVPKNNVSLLYHCALNKKTKYITMLLDQLSIYKCSEPLNMNGQNNYEQITGLFGGAQQTLNYKMQAIPEIHVSLKEYQNHLQRGTLLGMGINMLYKDNKYLTAQLLSIYIEAYFTIWMQVNKNIVQNTRKSDHQNQGPEIDIRQTMHPQFTQVQRDLNKENDNMYIQNISGQINNLTILKKQLDWVGQAELYLIFAYPSQILTDYFDNMIHPYFNISFGFRRATIWHLHMMTNLLVQRSKIDEVDYFNRRLSHLSTIMATTTYTNVKENTLLKYCKNQHNIQNYIKYLNYEDEKEAHTQREAQSNEQQNDQIDIFGRGIKEYKRLSSLVNMESDKYQIWYMNIIENL